MFFQKVQKKMKAIRELNADATPVLPLILDSLRLQRKEYEVEHCATGISFELHPMCGDWFTFYECCIRQDYLPELITLKPDEQILDIGGNFGAFSMMAASKIGPGGTIHCYEPSSNSAHRINRHLQRNDIHNVRVIQSAVGADSNKVSLFLHEKSALTTTIEGTVDGRHSASRQSVEIDQISITDVLKALPGRIALAKIDCEGAEYDIMDYIDPRDLKRIAAFSIETHKVPGRNRQDILQKLRQNGFEIYDGNPFHAINTALA